MIMTADRPRVKCTCRKISFGLWDITFFRLSIRPLDQITIMLGIWAE